MGVEGDHESFCPTQGAQTRRPPAAPPAPPTPPAAPPWASTNSRSFSFPRPSCNAARASRCPSSALSTLPPDEQHVAGHHRAHFGEILRPPPGTVSPSPPAPPPRLPPPAPGAGPSRSSAPPRACRHVFRSRPSIPPAPAPVARPPRTHPPPPLRPARTRRPPPPSFLLITEAAISGTLSTVAVLSRNA